MEKSMIIEYLEKVNLIEKSRAEIIVNFFFENFNESSDQISGLIEIANRDYPCDTERLYQFCVEIKDKFPEYDSLSELVFVLGSLSVYGIQHSSAVNTVKSSINKLRNI
jgi:hypothetical protein